MSHLAAIMLLVLSTATTILAGPRYASGAQPRRVVPDAPGLRAGGPDDYGYEFKDETEPGGPVFGWIDTVGSESTDIAGDDTTYRIGLPFPFRYYGQVYDSAWVCTNGWLAFGPTYPGNSFENDSVPRRTPPNNAIFAFWDDNAVGEFFNGSIYLKTVDTAPVRRFAVTWQDVACNFLADPVSFQVVLSEADSSITLQYADVLCSDPFSDSGGTATVGIESDTTLSPRQTGLLYSWDEKALCADRAIRFALAPQARNDVGVHAILVPGTHGRTGADLTPSALVRNYGLDPQSNVPVRCSIFGRRGELRYTDEYVIGTIPPSNSLTVYFDPWRPATPETCTVVMATWLSGDERPDNDRQARAFGAHEAHFFGGPDPGFMRWLDSDTAAGPTYNWRDIRATGTPILFPDYDNSVASIPVGFSFNFYDSLYTTAHVGTNGYLMFDPGMVRINNETIPSAADPNNTVYPFWDDLDCIDSGRVRYQVFGTTPNCTLVVSFDSVRLVQGGDSSISFQVLLCENSRDIVMQYRDVASGSPTGDDGVSATIGIEAGQGSIGLCYLFGVDTTAWPLGNLVSAGRAIRFYFGGREGDVGVTQIVAPSGYVNTRSRLVPQARCRNYHSMPNDFRAFMFLEDPTGTRVYAESMLVARLAPSSDTVISFRACTTGTSIGRWGVKCSTVCAVDTFPANDIRSDTFTLTSPAGIWTEMASLPVERSGRQVKDGGWLVWETSRGRAYAAKGNKSQDFYTYSPLLDTWALRSSIPLGREAKPPSKGATGCAGGSGFIYAVKGNNTCGFYRYDVEADTWLQMKDVPLGLTNKRVKGGAGLAYVVKPAGHQIYLLKGNKNEFYRFDVDADSWFALADAPRGVSPKWDKGSWLAYDGDHTIYAHKAKYHEFWAYDTDADSWRTGALTAMPMVSRSGRSKKSKDGGCGAHFQNNIYALKGGNTQEFWKYVPGGDSWIELDTLPALGSTGTRRKVKAGAGIAGMSSGLGVLKGSKTNEFWVYTPSLHATRFASHARAGVMADAMRGTSGVMRVFPNPLRAGFATLMLNGLAAGQANGPTMVSVIDATGRVFLHSSFDIRASSLTLDLRSMPVGVYMVKLTAGGLAATQKLVVQR